MAEIKLSLERREATGKNKVDKLRRDGIIPGVVYSKGNEARNVCGLEKDLIKVYEEAGSSNLISIDISDKNYMALFKDVQMHPFKNQMIHFDLYEVDMNEEIRVEIPIVLEGRDEIRIEPSTLIQVMDSIEIECLPKDLPSEAIVNVSSLEIGDNVSIKDLDIFGKDNITIFDDEEEIVATLVEPKEEEIEEETDEEVDAAEVPTVSETEEEEKEEEE